MSMICIARPPVRKRTPPQNNHDAKKSLLFQVTIKEMILKFIPKRIATFRLCPSTKFHFLPHSTMQTYGPVFIIDDGSQPKIELASKDRNIIAATFTHFLLKTLEDQRLLRTNKTSFITRLGSSIPTTITKSCR